MNGTSTCSKVSPRAPNQQGAALLRRGLLGSRRPRPAVDGRRGAGGGQGPGSGTGAGCAAEGVGSVARRGLLHGRCIRSPTKRGSNAILVSGSSWSTLLALHAEAGWLRPETGPTCRAVPARCSVVPIVPTAGLRRISRVSGRNQVRSCTIGNPTGSRDGPAPPAGLASLD